LPEGEFKLPLSALVASSLRGLYSTLGLGRKYTGEMLGETQWQWLKETLQETSADVHIIVSSIQILTSNPLFESWVSGSGAIRILRSERLC
jgi:alkaline phosphatase D